MLLFIEEFQIYGYNFLNWFSDFKIPSVTLSKIKDSIKPDGLEHEGKKKPNLSPDTCLRGNEASCNFF